MPTPSDEDLSTQIVDALAAWDAAKRRGADAGELEALGAALSELSSEREHRRQLELDEGLESGGELHNVEEDDRPPGDRELHEQRRQVLERWARELGLPFDLPPGTDLSDDEIFEEIQTDLYSYQEMIEELAKQPPPSSGSHVGKMGGVDRVIEAFKRAIDSGRIDDSAIEQLKQLLTPEALKWLPLLLGLGLGVGMLSGGWAIAAGLILAYGKSVYDLGKALYDIVNARNDGEYAAAVEELIVFLGGVGVDLLITLVSFGVGRAYRAVRGKPPTATPPSAGRGRRAPPAEPAAGPRRMAPRLRGRWAPSPGVPRKRPPWLDPERPPRPARGHGQRLSRMGASNPGAGLPQPRPPRRGPPRPSNAADEIQYGPTGGPQGLVHPDGRITIHPRLRSELLPSTILHELAHRMFRPATLAPLARARLAQRIGRLLETSHAIKFLDEVHAYARQSGHFDAHRFREVFQNMLGTPYMLRQYGVNTKRLLQELALLRRQPWFLRILRNPDDFFRMVERGQFDLEAFVRLLEEFARRNRKLRGRRRAAPRRLGP